MSAPTPAVQKNQPDAEGGVKSYKEAESQLKIGYVVDSYLPAFSHEIAFYEKLVLFNAGTVAVTINAVLGHLHGKVLHRHTLQWGIALLGIAIVMLLAHNLVATRMVSLMVDLKVYKTIGKDFTQEMASFEQHDNVFKVVKGVGVVCTGAGLILLLIVAITSV